MLGQGTFGCVHANTLLGQPVAVKILEPRPERSSTASEELSTAAGNVLAIKKAQELLLLELYATLAVENPCSVYCLGFCRIPVRPFSPQAACLA